MTTANRMRRLERLENQGEGGWASRFAGITAAEWELVDLAPELPEPWPAETVVALAKVRTAMGMVGSLRDVAMGMRL